MQVGLWVKPAGANVDDFNKEVDKLEGALEQDIAEYRQECGGQIPGQSGRGGRNDAVRAGEKELASAATLGLRFQCSARSSSADHNLYIADGIWTAGRDNDLRGGQQG